MTTVRTAQARRYPSAIDDRFREGTSMHRLAALGLCSGNQSPQRRIQPQSLACIGALQTELSKWGNSPAVRLPATVVDALGLKEGDQIEIQVAGKHAFAVAKAPGTRELLARLRKFRGRLPATFKFDRLEANERL